MTTEEFTDLTLEPYTFSKPECGLLHYSIIGTDAIIFDNNKVRFKSDVEQTLSFSLIVTAIGNAPATLTLTTTIKIVNCSSGNIITGGSWN